MKNNGPVTQRDIPMRQGMAIISHTDSKGRIIYVNDDFVEISGFTREECIGKSHNMVRHPDMPPEAFRDLWDTVKAGRPWQGIVKNRCKNGDHYWVKATVTPRGDGNYMSVRTAPSSMEVRQAEQLYADMLRHDNYRLEGGVVHKKGASSIVSRFRTWMGNRSFFTKLTAPMLIVWTLAIGVVAYQMNEMRTDSLMIAGQHSAQDLINTAFNARSFYAEHVLPKARNAGLEMTHDFVGKMHAVPLPASLMRSIAEMSANNAGEGANLRLYSNQPFKFRTSAESRLDAFETEAFDYLSKNPSEFYARIEQTDNGPVYRYARADVMRDQACINCHNNHPDTPKKDWKIGDVRGVIAASMPLNSLNSAQTKSMLGLAITLLSVLTFSIVAMLLIARKQKQNLDDVARIADDISHGDLTTEVPQGRTDEVGRIFGALQIMRNRLYEIAFQMRQTSVNLNEKASLMTTASEEVSHGANSQAHASESMAAALEELTASVEQIGNNATAVYGVAETTGYTAQAGAAAVRESVKKMKDIADRVTQSASSVTDLKELSKQIGGIVSSIRGIAEQTNLLALNAAIEAARAGAYGRGFAVVADEVRVLAGRTADSTKEITAMVDAIQDSTTNAVAMMEAGVHEVAAGVEIAETAGNSVASIEAKTAEVVAAVHDIQHVLQEQALAAREVARTVEDISGFAHSNAQSADKSLNTSKELAGVAKVMDNISSEFKT